MSLVGYFDCSLHCHNFLSQIMHTTSRKWPTFSWVRPSQMAPLSPSLTPLLWSMHTSLTPTPWRSRVPFKYRRQSTSSMSSWSSLSWIIWRAFRPPWGMLWLPVVMPWRQLWKPCPWAVSLRRSLWTSNPLWERFDPFYLLFFPSPFCPIAGVSELIVSSHSGKALNVGMQVYFFSPQGLFCTPSDSDSHVTWTVIWWFQFHINNTRLMCNFLKFLFITFC